MGCERTAILLQIYPRLQGREPLRRKIPQSLKPMNIKDSWMIFRQVIHWEAGGFRLPGMLAYRSFGVALMGADNRAPKAAPVGRRVAFAQRRWNWVFPNRMSRDLSSWGAELLASASTCNARTTAGRASIALNQR